MATTSRSRNGRRRLPRPNVFGIDNILIDENIVETGSMIDAFRFATEIPNMGIGRVAFVDRYLDHHETNAFGELVAQNRDLNCKIFNNTTEAEQWLVN